MRRFLVMFAIAFTGANASGRGTAVEPVSHVVFFVDTSSSTVGRDEEKLRAFFRLFFDRQRKNARISSAPFHLRGDTFLSPGRCEGVMTLHERPLGGATKLVEALERIGTAPTDVRIILLSDGMQAIGSAECVTDAIARLRQRVTVISASPTADTAVLKGFAAAGDGWHIDLARLSVEEAVEAAMREPPASRIPLLLPIAPADRAGWSIAGTVTVDGEPLPGATIMLYVGEPPGTITISDANGRFVLPAPRAPGAFTIRAELAGFDTAMQTYPHGAAHGTTADLAMKAVPHPEVAPVPCMPMPIPPLMDFTTPPSRFFPLSPRAPGSGAQH